MVGGAIVLAVVFEDVFGAGVAAEATAAKSRANGMNRKRIVRL
jgi:hypothetical protein